MVGNSPDPYVTVMTLNWNNGEDIQECVAALHSMTYPNYDVVVIDNGSTDGSLAALRAHHPVMAILENGRNLGYAAGFNAGLRYAFERGADFCLLVNSDAMIDPEALTEMVRVAEGDAKIGLVTGKVYWYSRPDVFQTAGRYTDPILLAGQHVASGEVDRGQCDEVRDFEFVDDVYLLFRREVFEQVGGYSTIFPVYYGITDLCARVRRAGFRIVYAPGSKIWHKGIIGNENVTLSASRLYYIIGHQIPFMWRNASNKQFATYISRTLLSLPESVLRYIKHGNFASLWAHLRGIGYGLFWLARHPRRPATN